MSEKRRTPVTILTGFLGAGKTTLLNHLMRSLSTLPNVPRVAVIENEFAEAFGIENEIIDQSLVSALEELYEFGQGCVCCSSSGQLVQALAHIAQRNGKKRTVDWVVLETTGLADPGPVAAMLASHTGVREDYYVDAVVTVVDAPHFLARLQERGTASTTGSGTDSRFKNEPLAQIVHADQVVVNKVDAPGVDRAAIEAAIRQLNPDAPIQFVSYGAVDAAALLDLDGHAERASTEAKAETLGLSEQAHDPSIQSIGALVDASVNTEALLEYLRGLVRELGQDVYRIKGVLSAFGEPNKLVLQGVEGDLVLAPHRAWGDEPRASRVTVIGRNVGRKGGELLKKLNEFKVVF